MSKKTVVTRFAPSPTGYLHIGGARTALFNWLFARHHGGEFLLRIEDTDRARSTPEATEAIFAGLKWLELDWDGAAVSQFARVERHREVAHQLLEKGAAYRCYATAEEIEAAREAARAEGRSTLYQSPWRDADPALAPKGAPFAIRIKAPLEGEIVIADEVQGDVRFQARELDDMVLLRSDGTPTYMLAVVVDDHDMGVTHVIRGDDHLINAGRQSLIFTAMGWDLPVFAHIPLIHGEDGKKLSKRHGALGVEAYRDMGYLPEAMRNYLARLGWSHGNDELFSTKEAVEWFSLKGLGKAPARLDFKKLDHVSAHHIKTAEDARLVEALGAFMAAGGEALDPALAKELGRAMYCLKERAKTLPELFEKAYFLRAVRPIEMDEKARALLDDDAVAMLHALKGKLAGQALWEKEPLEACLRAFADMHDLKLGQVAQPLRAALSGRGASPSVFDMMVILGQEETLGRLSDL